MAKNTHAPDMYYFDIWYGLEITYDVPAQLEVWLGTDSCRFEKRIWQSPAIDHEEWKPYTFNTDPLSQSYRYLIFKTAYAHSKPAYGNVLIDNLKVAPECRVHLPNAFSPNGDHLNDRFYPK